MSIPEKENKYKSARLSSQIRPEISPWNKKLKHFIRNEKQWKNLPW